MSAFKTLAAVSAIVWTGLFGAPAAAQPASVAPVNLAPLTRADLEIWLDGFMPYALHQGDVAGAVVVVVKDGQVLLEKGYGYSDVKARTPVSPTETLFRPGSISKTFTWTAVMQLVEQHKIDLDQDINTYLDFKIPPRDGKPVTMRQLMQHTAGFGEIAKHLIVDDTAHQLTLERYLKTWTPPRIFAPGEVVAYSNYGATLAGYIVQRVSGEPYDTYIADHILKPLGMAHSTMAQPLPANLSPLLSKGYLKASGPPQKYEIINPAPAGSMTTSGDDMSRFMLAHLGHGTFGGVQILKADTAAQMYGQTLEPTPPLPGFALGFYHEDRNGHEIIGHAGDSNLFHSDLHLYLKDGVGLFISENSAGNAGAAQTIRGELFRAFTDRYFPAPTLAEPTLASAKHDGAMMTGSWWFSRRAQNSLLDVVYILGQMTITMTPDGIVTVSGLKSSAGVPIQWREVAPFVWRQVGGESRMAAVVKDGQVTAIGMDNEPPVFVLQRATGLQQAGLVLPLLGASVALLALVVLSWPVSALARRRYGKAFAHVGARATAYRLTRIIALADVIFIVGMLATLLIMVSTSLVIDGANDWVFRLFQLFGLIGLLGIVVGPWNLVTAWRDPAASWWAKLVGVLLAAALIVIPVLGITLHLLTASLNY